MLSTLPPSGAGVVNSGFTTTNYSLGYIWIGEPNNPVTFQATGLDKGMLVETYVNGYPVTFQ